MLYCFLFLGRYILEEIVININVSMKSRDAFSQTIESLIVSTECSSKSFFKDHLPLLFFTEM